MKMLPCGRFGGKGIEQFPVNGIRNWIEFQFEGYDVSWLFAKRFSERRVDRKDETAMTHGEDGLAEKCHRVYTSLHAIRYANAGIKAIGMFF